MTVVYLDFYKSYCKTNKNMKNLPSLKVINTNIVGKYVHTRKRDQKNNITEQSRMRIFCPVANFGVFFYNMSRILMYNFY